jgi:hypothetical protein
MSLAGTNGPIGALSTSKGNMHLHRSPTPHPSQLISDIPINGFEPPAVLANQIQESQRPAVNLKTGDNAHGEGRRKGGATVTNSLLQRGAKPMTAIGAPRRRSLGRDPIGPFFTRTGAGATTKSQILIISAERTASSASSASSSQRRCQAPVPGSSRRVASRPNCSSMTSSSDSIEAESVRA